MTRPDLQALTDDALAALANRGIVKRALREVAEGLGPSVAEDDEGAVTGTFADGTTVLLPAGRTIGDGTCSCPAAGVCRHRVMVVLALRGASSPDAGSVPVEAGADPPAKPPTASLWSPGGFTDDELLAALGTRVVAVARKAERSGYRARVRRGAAPGVELSSCTVTFLVPHELGYARVDAAGTGRQDAVALAVWACRVADAADPDAEVLDVAVGGLTAAAGGPRASGLEPVLPLLADLLADGVVSSAASMATTVLQARRPLERRNLRWPIDALDELASQLDAYRSRASSHRPERVAALMAELVARHRCVAGAGASLAPGVLGSEEAAETPMRLVRMVGLGARVTGDESWRSVDVYLAHPDTGLVLTLRRRIEVADGAVPPTGATLGQRKAGGAKLAAVAAGNVVTESAKRSANRSVRLAESRIARTTVTPSTGDWGPVLPGLLVSDLEAETARLAGLAPAVVRPRVLAEELRVVEVVQVEHLGYQPGSQQLTARVSAPVGTSTVVLDHRSVSPGAIDALAAALQARHGPVRYVAGHLRREGGEVVIEPTAVVTGSSVVVPAFAPVTGVEVEPPVRAGQEPVSAAVGAALALSAELVHRGWRHLPEGWRGRAEAGADQLRQVGLGRAGAALAELVAATKTPVTESTLDRWADVHLRLMVTAEQL